MEYID